MHAFIIANYIVHGLLTLLTTVTQFVCGKLSHFR